MSGYGVLNILTSGDETKMQWKWWYWPVVLYGAWIIFGVIRRELDGPWTFDYEHFLVLFVPMGFAGGAARWLWLAHRYGVAGARARFWVQSLSDPRGPALIKLSLVLAAMAFALTWYLSGRNDVAPQTPQARAAEAVADRYVATRFPEYDRKQFPMAVKEEGDTWRVFWKLPPNVLGGSPVVILKKSDLSLVRFYVEQ